MSFGRIQTMCALRKKTNRRHKRDIQNCLSFRCLKESVSRKTLTGLDSIRMKDMSKMNQSAQETILVVEMEQRKDTLEMATIVSRWSPLRDIELCSRDPTRLGTADA